MYLLDLPYPGKRLISSYNTDTIKSWDVITILPSVLGELPFGIVFIEHSGVFHIRFSL